ncbi:hypothetical protein C0Q70_04267 [Pomacea canaliculata]|uniref:Uncharacterized protein n=1 Tax=Pomacea canaliculata TaxID=400727 RepID=A0A2T7PV46_POMCA|nr:hypothetical protein C0Q70_04267 [Pomacea canaliculata]
MELLVTTYGWSRAAANHLLPFICEISREEAYRIIEDSRDFGKNVTALVTPHITRVSKGVCACCMYTDYGLDVLDPNDVPRGPKFIDQPDNIMAVEGIASVVIDCTAAANPSPTYRMYKILVNNTIPITTDMDSRCTTIDL